MYPAFPSPIQPPSATSVVKRLYLCRHGRTAANASGVMQGSGIDQPLNAQGVEQANRLRERLDGIPCDLIVSSALERARQTARAVHEKHSSVPFIEVPELAEISWGDWEGGVYPDLRALLGSWEDGDFSAKAPNGESPLDCEKRSVPPIYKLLERDESNIIVVIHGRLLRIIMSSLFFGSLAHMSEFVHHNTCINVVDVIIESDPTKVHPMTEAQRQSSFTALAKGTSGRRILDDNVDIEEDSAEASAHDRQAKRESGKSPVTWTPHPPHITFVPVVLDSIDHLPAHLR
ncbi:hypothetical protein HKX48_008408 [Thoreauomyces humboldtii]|nr:hypothetical protein HKX48_008408 [Thoreauomyces humboldtii]